jgi:hypothetical protein
LQRLRAPPQIGSILHGHYDQFKHEVSGQVLDDSSSFIVILCEFHDIIRKSVVFPYISFTSTKSNGNHMRQPIAGVPLDLLMPDFWVPGMTSRQECSKFVGKPLWQQILQTSGEVSVLWLTRLTKEPMVFYQATCDYYVLL